MAQFRKDTHQYLNDGQTIYEVVMLADQYGNLVGPANPSGMSVDAFGRARVAHPKTLFDSFNRFGDNGHYNYSNTATATYTFSQSTSSLDMEVDTTSGAKVYRETKKVFAYQPGKSLQILNTFVMNEAQDNLRQRIGYFGDENGFFVQRSGSTVSFVKRSKVTGSVVDTEVTQANWNIDPLDGTGPSLLTLNLDNPQILFIDVEWLGVGSVRMGFVINGQFIHCHSFHHANLDASAKGAYIQTACLPIRNEIENTDTTSANSTLKAICSTVISEGGYELEGTQRTVGLEPTSTDHRILTLAGTYYPVVSIRLNPDRKDAIIIPKQIDVLPINSANYKWLLVKDATITGGVWANVTGSSVQYNSNNTATMTGGTTINAGYVTSTVQGAGSMQVSGDTFQYQLERNSFANTTTTLTLAVTSGTATSNVCGQILWDEIT